MNLRNLDFDVFIDDSRDINVESPEIKKLLSEFNARIYRVDGSGHLNLYNLAE